MALKLTDELNQTKITHADQLQAIQDRHEKQINDLIEEKNRIAVKFDEAKLDMQKLLEARDRLSEEPDGLLRMQKEMLEKHASELEKL